MTWSIWDIVFIVSLLILAVVPKKKVWWLLFFAVLAINIAIRIYYIHSSHVLRRELHETKKLVEAPTLAIATQEITKVGSSYKLTLGFTPSKNEPLGIIVFVATILDNTDAKILDFWPSNQGGAFSSGKDSKKIREDGKQARLAYALIAAGRPVFDLTISSKAKIEIKSNYMRNSLVVTVAEHPEQSPAGDGLKAAPDA